MDRQQMIDALKVLPDQVSDAVRGLNERQLDTPYRQDGWTVRQVVHHLADSHMNAFIRVKLILTEERPALKPYSQDDWARLSDSRLPVDASVAILRGLHERWAELLGSLPQASWNRAGFHPERGEVTVDSLLATYAGHGAKHVEQILSLRRAKGW
jgi:hypothetical protein